MDGEEGFRKEITSDIRNERPSLPPLRFTPHPPPSPIKDGGGGIRGAWCDGGAMRAASPCQLRRQGDATLFLHPPPSFIFRPCSSPPEGGMQMKKKEECMLKNPTKANMNRTEIWVYKVDNKGELALIPNQPFKTKREALRVPPPHQVCATPPPGSHSSTYIVSGPAKQPQFTGSRPRRGGLICPPSSIIFYRRSREPGGGSHWGGVGGGDILGTYVKWGGRGGGKI
nr:hypothetical protein [Morchella crassipes]